jgi:hypothetical protein
VEHINCACALAGKMTSCLWIVACGLHICVHSVQHDEMLHKACQGAIFKVVLQQSVRNAWQNVQISEHVVFWPRFEACICSEREL